MKTIEFSCYGTIKDVHINDPKKGLPFAIVKIKTQGTFNENGEMISLPVSKSDFVRLLQETIANRVKIDLSISSEDFTNK
jgi:hypothetical protein